MRAMIRAGGAAAILALAACGGGNSPAGRWGMTKMSSFEIPLERACSERSGIEFASDGQVRGTRTDQVGTWRQSGQTITMSVRGREQTLRLEGDTMTMLGENGGPVGTLQRCPN